MSDRHSSRVDPPQVESPCNRICTLNPDNVCIGCGRTLHEIMRWTEVDDTERLRIRNAAIRRVAAERGGFSHSK
jgi:hypothetical protein